MQSYASPGRVITVANTGTDAVAVRADQPYRLGNLVGVTDGPAGVGDDLNLCVEGVFEQMVDLADGVEAAEVGTPVLMNVATFALVVGLTDATDHVHFGVLAERMTRRRVVLVKLMPATAAAPATGGGDGGETPVADPVLVMAGLTFGPSYQTSNAFTRLYASYNGNIDGVPARGTFVVRNDGFLIGPSRYPNGEPNPNLIGITQQGIYEVEVVLTMINNNLDQGIIINGWTYDQAGTMFAYISPLTEGQGCYSDNPSSQRTSSNESITRRLPVSSGHPTFRCRKRFWLGEGWKFGIQVCVTGVSTNDNTYLDVFSSYDNPADTANDPYAFERHGERTSIIVRRVA